MTAPANDNIANAIPIDISSGSYTSPPIDNSEATTEAAEAESTNVHSLWWSISYPVSIDIELDTAQSTPLVPGGSTDTTIAIYTDDGGATLQYIDSNDDDETAPAYGEPGWTGASRMSFTMGAGTTYLIRVSGYSEADVFNAVLHVTAANVPQPTTIDLVPGNPVDQSTPGYATGNPDAAPTMPLGGLMGDGSLATNDGDASGVVIWETGMFDSHPAGNDQWQYSVDTAGLIPADAVAVRATLDLTLRVVERTTGFWYDWDGVFHSGPPEGDQAGWQIVMPDGQAYAPLRVSFETSGTALSQGTGEVTWFDYQTVGLGFSAPVAEWDDGLTITFSANSNSGTDEPRAEMRITAAVLHLTYYGGTTPVTFAVAPPLRQFPRSDGRVGSAKRMLDSRSRQSGLRRVGDYL